MRDGVLYFELVPVRLGVVECKIVLMLQAYHQLPDRYSNVSSDVQRVPQIFADANEIRARLSLSKLYPDVTNGFSDATALLSLTQTLRHPLLSASYAFRALGVQIRGHDADLVRAFSSFTGVGSTWFCACSNAVRRLALAPFMRCNLDCTHAC